MLPDEASYLDVVEIFLFHSFHMWNPCWYTAEVVLDRIVGVPSYILGHVSIVLLDSKMIKSLTSGEDILTRRTFSSIIFGSSHIDSIKSVYTWLAAKSWRNASGIPLCSVSQTPWRESGAQRLWGSRRRISLFDHSPRSRNVQCRRGTFSQSFVVEAQTTRRLSTRSIQCSCPVRQTRWPTVDKEIIIGHILSRTDGSTSIVT